MSIVASTLANGGVNPYSGIRVCSPENVRCALPLMLMCGMYEDSGRWAFEVGIPAKSGVSGNIIMVIPNVGGISVWSPRLDDVNSTRGVAVAKELVKRVRFHNFETLIGFSSKKEDVNIPHNCANAKQAEISTFLDAAIGGDLTAMQKRISKGTNVFTCDYDYRSALHLAAAQGHYNLLSLLIDQCSSIEEKEKLVGVTDRWGGTPLSEAMHYGHADCIELLSQFGGKVGETKHLKNRLA